jgi:hypothetical protein
MGRKVSLRAGLMRLQEPGDTSRLFETPARLFETPARKGGALTLYAAL